MNLEVSDVLAVARELKMPLATLRQLALMLDQMGEDGERIRSEMVGVSERAMRQVNDLMRLQKLECGLFEMEPVAVRAVCAEAQSEISRLYTGCEIEVKYRNRIPLVVANRELLEGAVYNCLLTALSAARDKVLMTLRDTRGGVEIAVRDRGPALAAMRPGELPMTVATRFSQYMRAETGVVRHRDGMSFLMWLPRSEQRSLW